MNVEKVELYKVKNCGNLYIDAEGNPFVVTPKSCHRGGRYNTEKLLMFTKSKYFERNTSLFLKNIVARTLIDENAKYVNYKDGDPDNCHPDNLEVTSKYFRPFNFTDENSFVCNMCGKRIFKVEDNYKSGMCSSCKYVQERLKVKEKKENKYKALYKHLDENRRYFRQTELRNKILECFSEGKNYSETADTIGVSRQCVNSSIQKALDLIERKKKILGGN